jgi:hypothetical protein
MFPIECRPQLMFAFLNSQRFLKRRYRAGHNYTAHGYPHHEYLIFVAVRKPLSLAWLSTIKIKLITLA